MPLSIKVSPIIQVPYKLQFSPHSSKSLKNTKIFFFPSETGAGTAALVFGLTDLARAVQPAKATTSNRAAA